NVIGGPADDAGCGAFPPLRASAAAPPRTQDVPTVLHRRRFSGGLAALPLALAAPAIAQQRGDVLRSGGVAYRLVTLSRDLEQPWSIAFLPGGRLLITERPGRLRLFADGKLVARPLEGVPPVRAAGQGGLLDVCLHPAFASNQVI